jgi:hypothetical protein
MKKLFLISALCFLGFASCKKDYQCVCTNVNTGTVSYGDKMEESAFTKKAAEKACENNNNLSGGSLKDCHLEDYQDR